MKVNVIKKVKKDAYLTRGEQAIKFVREYTNSQDMDEPWLTPRRLLLSFGFELILKSKVISMSKATNKPMLEKELMDIGHNFTNFKTALGGELAKIGIIDIQTKSSIGDYSYYIIKTKEGDIEVENLNDIRYKNKPREHGAEEHKKIMQHIERILGTAKKIRLTTL